MAAGPLSSLFRPLDQQTDYERGQAILGGDDPDIAMVLGDNALQEKAKTSTPVRLEKNGSRTLVCSGGMGGPLVRSHSTILRRER